MAESAEVPTAALQLAPVLRERLERAASRGYPYEVCGLLIGARDGAYGRVRSVREARNLNTERAQDRFELDPLDYLAAQEQASAEGTEIVGVWHSHPDHSALPSATDGEFAWSGWSYVILSVVAGRCVDVRSWRWTGSGFVEEALES